MNRLISMMRLMIVATTVGAAAGGCGSTESNPMPPSTINFELRNDGAQSVYLFQNCLIDYTITSLADPTHTITRIDGCGCDCSLSSCSVCGACAHSAIEIAAGGTQTDSWLAVDITTQTRPAGACQVQKTLPAGSYRIDVPVYASDADATAGTAARTASQTFTLPASPDDRIAVALGVSP
jgi:hypothetical protein